MDVTTVGIHKRELESKLTAAVVEFQKITGCAVSVVQAQYSHVIEAPLPIVTGITITVEVP